jgi:hypothetical protein
VGQQTIVLLFCGNVNYNHLISEEIFVLKQSVTRAINRVQCACDSASRTVLRGHWCNFLLLNAHALKKNKRDVESDCFCEERKEVFEHFPKYYVNIFFRIQFKIKKKRQIQN